MTMTRSRWALLLIVLVLAGGGVYAYWQYKTAHPSTSDAYLTAHVVRIEPQVGGQIARLPVRDHEHVTQGQILLEIDDRPFRIAVQQAQAQLSLAKQQKLAADAAVEVAGAMVSQRQAELNDARHHYERDTRLLARQDVSKAQADSDRDKLDAAQASLKEGQAGYRQSQRDQDAAVARIAVAEAALDQARLNLSYTTITAPASGTLGKISARPGDIVQAGQQLFPLVEDQTFWVEANYKEGDLERIRPGQSARIMMDMYPGRTFKGVVESLSPASGVAFSLLPPENATGNWVKVTQRFPVRIRVVTRDDSTPLRIGSSCSVTIDATQSAKPVNLFGLQAPTDWPDRQAVITRAE
jgi:membrane fusion protein, multidrug efflux system